MRRGTFYPQKMAQRCELAFASRMLSTIEINGFGSRDSANRKIKNQVDRLTILRRMRSIACIGFNPFGHTEVQF